MTATLPFQRRSVSGASSRQRLHNLLHPLAGQLTSQAVQVDRSICPEVQLRQWPNALDVLKQTNPDNSYSNTVASLHHRE